MIEFDSFDVIGIICNDAGAAEILSELALLLIEKHKIQIYATGPAAEIFAKKHLHINSTSLNTIILESDLILTGTGWQTSLEIDTIKLSRRHNKPCHVVLDHWQEYRIRFKDKEGIYRFPDKIYVTNFLAHWLVKNQIPEIPSFRIPELYVESQISQIIQLDTELKESLKSPLYLSDGQPYSSDSKYSQNRKLEDLVASRKHIEKYFSTSLNEINIRPHPADLELNCPPNEICGVRINVLEGELAELINASSIVIGTDTMAMYVAMRLGKSVLTLVDEINRPPWMDFCASLQEVLHWENHRSRPMIVLTDAKHKFYLREFSILDLDEQHLSWELSQSQIPRNITPENEKCFEIQKEKLEALRNKGNRRLSIVDLSHQRIGFIDLNSELHCQIVDIKVFFYDEENKNELDLEIQYDAIKRLQSCNF